MSTSIDFRNRTQILRSRSEMFSDALGEPGPALPQLRSATASVAIALHGKPFALTNSKTSSPDIDFTSVKRSASAPMTPLCLATRARVALSC